MNVRASVGRRCRAFLEGLEDAILSLTSSVWIYPAVWAVAVIDGIFPPVPSESVVIAAATTWEQTGKPTLGVHLDRCGPRRLVRRPDRVLGRQGDSRAKGSRHARAARPCGPRLGRARARAPRDRVHHRGAVHPGRARGGQPHRRGLGLPSSPLHGRRRGGAPIWATYSIGLGSLRGLAPARQPSPQHRDRSPWAASILGYLVDLIMSKVGVRPARAAPRRGAAHRGTIARRRAPRAADAKPEARREPARRSEARASARD